MGLKTPSFRLDGKQALVIGASSGIGRASAVALGEYGATVTAVARREDALAKTLAMIEVVGGSASAVVLDVKDLAAVSNLVASRGPFDILLNAAGMARHAPALQTTEEDFTEVTNLNFKSAYFLAQAVAQGLIDAGRGGSLITISSQMGHTGGVERAVYAGTKHALEGMTKSMAIEWGKYGIRVNTICPTFIHTELTASTLDDPKKVHWIEEKIKLGRIGRVEDIMGAVVYLASEASALVTGSSLLIDGGWTAG